MKTVIFSKQAEKALRKMPANRAKTVREKVDQLAANPESLANNVTKLVGRSGYRLTVGDWRVLFDDEGNVLAITAIRPRGNAYE